METTHQRALSKFGEQNQHLKMIEEMAELTQAIIKRTNVSEEIADVQIVLDQIKLSYPEWKTWEQIKLKRLEEKLGESR
jgi:NTP pyrophosphatase (non-canonical NTP hydrolase)